MDRETGTGEKMRFEKGRLGGGGWNWDWRGRGDLEGMGKEARG